MMYHLLFGQAPVWEFWLAWFAPWAPQEPYNGDWYCQIFWGGSCEENCCAHVACHRLEHQMWDCAHVFPVWGPIAGRVSPRRPQRHIHDTDAAQTHHSVPECWRHVHEGRHKLPPTPALLYAQDHLRYSSRTVITKRHMLTQQARL